MTTSPSTTPGQHVVVLRVPSPGEAVRSELASAAVRRALVAEACGTLLFVFLAAGTTMVSAGIVGERLSSARILLVALAHGLAFGLAVAGAAALSGGHLNPAITLGAVVAGRMSVARGAMYAVAQILGAAGAALLLKLVMPNAPANGLGIPALGPRVTAGGAVVIETLLTFALVLGFFATATKSRRQLAAVTLGATVVLAHLFAFSLTGASMNPARSVGPALIAGLWTNHWVYWLGPLAGGVLAALAWRRGWADPGDVGPFSLNGDDSSRRLDRAAP